MANPSLRFKRGTQSAFNAVGLNTGEPAFITDDYNFYIGLDGNSTTNKYFGSARYWTKETSTQGSGVNLVEGTNNGAHFITLASPAAVGAAVTYYFPASNGPSNSTLTNDGTGILSWSSGSANPVFTGIATFNTTLVDINSDVDISGITTVSNTTDSTTKDNGSLVIEGGVGIEKSLNVGGNLKVTGISTFVGAVTFEGGTITLGDVDTDSVVFNADVNSGILPNTDATFDIGDASVSKRWRNASFSGVGTFATGAVIDAIQIGISSTNEIDTSSGVLILDSTAGQVQIDDHLSVAGVSTFSGQIDANAGADISGGETTLSSATVSDLTATRIVLVGTSGSLEDDSSLTFSDATGLVVANSGINITGVSTFSTDVVINGDLQVNGGDVTSTTASLNLFNTTVTTANVLGLANNVLFGATTGITTVRNNLTVGGDLRIDGNDIQASDGNTNITLTSNTLTSFAGDIQVNGNDIKSSANGGTLAISLNSADVAIAGKLQINGNDIRSSTGATVVTLNTDDATFASDVTINGDLFVNGSTTQVNTTTLTIEDNLIELGRVNNAAPTSDLNKDVGLLLHYFDDAAARLSAVFYDDSVSRVVVAQRVSESSGVLTVDAGFYANFELQGLFVTDTAGSGEAVISYATINGVTARHLQNITVDGGTF